jgi:Arc/MetJ-type ribon-helix-helix transcriptional regulator
MPEKWTIRFPPALQAAVERAVEAGHVVDRSELVRAAIREWDGHDTVRARRYSPGVSRLDPPAETKRVCVRLPAALAAKIDREVEHGPYPTASHAVRAAVREWVQAEGFLEGADADV